MSGLFGGVDLGTPAERQRWALEREFTTRRSQLGSVYPHGGAMCLQHGTFRSGRLIPDDYRPVFGLAHTCFVNAQMAARADARLTYCEGYATVGMGAHILHGWCIAPDDGVVEVTYPTGTGKDLRFANYPGLVVGPPETWGYYGLTFQLSLVDESFATYGPGLLDRVPAEAATMRLLGMAEEDIADGRPLPLLNVPYDPNRKELPPQ